MIRLSYSALNIFQTCERKFQLDRLLESGYEREDTPHTVFGSAYGAGIQSYMVHQDIDKAILDTYLAYYPVLESDFKTEESAISLLLSSKNAMDNLLQDWEVLETKKGKAVELSFRLNIDEKFYFVGYIDLALKNKWNGKTAILEIKTTGLQLHDLDPLYKNSGQALGYSIVLDAISGQDNSDYDVLYLIAQLGKANTFNSKIHLNTYSKTLTDRLNWFISLKMDVERIHMMLDNNIFPMRGGSCLQYMKPCFHMHTCNLTGFDKYKEEVEDKIDYDFTYNLDDVIKDHLLRMEK